MKKTLTAAVLLIGDELLSGSICDENLGHIATTLEQRGIRVRETRIVPDIEDDIVDAANALRKRYDYVFTTGGVGPTHDDITSDSIAAAFGVKNIIQQPVFDLIKGYLDGKGIEFTAAAQRMAFAPEGAEMIYGANSMIPGYRVDNVFVMAGVPRIMKMMLSAIVETLQIGSTILSREVHADISEGEIAAALEEIQTANQNVDIGSYPQDTGSTRSDYRVVFVVRGTELDEIEQVCKSIYGACIDLKVRAQIAESAE